MRVCQECVSCVCVRSVCCECVSCFMLESWGSHLPTQCTLRYSMYSMYTALLVSDTGLLESWRAHLEGVSWVCVRSVCRECLLWVCVVSVCHACVSGVCIMIVCHTCVSWVCVRRVCQECVSWVCVMRHARVLRLSSRYSMYTVKQCTRFKSTVHIE